MEIILASQSHRRRELLERMGVKNFRIVTPDIDEHMERALPPEELVRRISAEKARAVREQAGMDAVVIAADTVVALDGAVLGKPADELEAFKMLSTLSGCRHQVYTGLTVLRGEERHTGSEETTVASGQGLIATRRAITTTATKGVELVTSAKRLACITE